MKCITILLFCVLFFAHTALCAPPNYPFRTWTSITGDTVYAKFKKQDNDFIFLITDSNNIIKIKLGSLVAADQICVTWQYTPTDYNTRLKKHLPDLLEYASDRLVNKDQTAYDNTLLLLRSWVTINTDSLLKLKEIGLLKIKEPSYYAGTGLSKNDEDDVLFGTISNWLLSEGYKEESYDKLMRKISRRIIDENMCSRNESMNARQGNPETARLRREKQNYQEEDERFPARSTTSTRSETTSGERTPYGEKRKDTEFNSSGLMTQKNKYPINTSPTAPWNNPIYKDSPMAPHNSPIYKDSLLKPWNSLTGSEKDLTPAERKAYGLPEKKSW